MYEKIKTGCVILNYNDAESTIKLLLHISSFSIFDQIVIVDNCSLDNSYELISKFANRNISVIKTSHNGGYGYGNNFGIYFLLKYNIDIVIISNPDVIFDEKTVEKMIKTFDSNSDVAIVSPMALNSNMSKTLEFAWKLEHPFFELLKTSSLFRKISPTKIYNKSDFSSKEYLEVDIVPGSLLAINVEKFLEVQLFDENVFLYCEERIIATKFKEKGYSTILLINEIYQHNHSTSIKKSINSDLKRKKIWIKSRKYYLQKYRFKNVLGTLFVNLFFIYLKIELYFIFILKKIWRFRNVESN